MEKTLSALITLKLQRASVSFDRWGENYLQQYSQAKLQRLSLMRQRIEQKDADFDNAKQAGKVQPTISEDTADGQTAKSDALLKLLSDDKICFRLPTDELNNAELDIPESKF